MNPSNCLLSQDCQHLSCNAIHVSSCSLPPFAIGEHWDAFIYCYYSYSRCLHTCFPSQLSLIPFDMITAAILAKRVSDWGVQRLVFIGKPLACVLVYTTFYSYTLFLQPQSLVEYSYVLKLFTRSFHSGHHGRGSILWLTMWWALVLAHIYHCWRSITYTWACIVLSRRVATDLVPFNMLPVFSNIES